MGRERKESMKKQTQLQRLRKNPRISHLNSWYNRPFIEWLSGRMDGKRFQFCDLEGGHITPYIHRKSHFLDTYINKLYRDVTREFNETYQLVHSLCTELKEMEDPEKPIEGINPEEYARRSAELSSKIRHNKIRRKEILLQMSSLNESILMTDLELKNHIEASEDIAATRYANYWKGILETKQLNEYLPLIPERKYDGRIEYYTHRDRVLSLLREYV